MWYNVSYTRRRPVLKAEAVIRAGLCGRYLLMRQERPGVPDRERRMKNRNILVGILSTVCVILIAVIALFSVRLVNISDSAAQKKTEVRESTGSGGEDRTESSPEAGGSKGKKEANADSAAVTGSRADGTAESGGNSTAGSAVGESRAEASGTTSAGGQGASGEAASGEYEIDGVLYMADGRPVYEYLDPPEDSAVDYCPFDVEEFVASVASVYQTAHDSGYEYGNSSTLPPCADGFIACDRMIARALWDLGYTDQPQGGMQIISGDLTEEKYLTTHGFIKINDQSKLRRGDIVLQDDGKGGGPKYTWHTFVLVDYDPVTQICSKYDCGHFTPEGIDRVSSEQPFTCPLADFGDQRRFVCAFRIRTEAEPSVYGEE